MKMKNFTFAILGVFLLASNSLAFENKNIDSFKTLSEFKSVDDFEKYYTSYTQECLDNGFGGTGSIPCFVGYKIWDKELNVYYKKLLSKLNKDEKTLLKTSQKAWLKYRDLSIKLNSSILEKIYTEPGTMYLLMRAGDADSLISPIIKERVLTLKRWYKVKTSER